MGFINVIVKAKFFWNVFKPLFSLFLIVCWGWYIQLLNVIVPRPRLNLIRFHGVLAPNAKLRAEIIPDGKKSKPTDANDDVPRSPAQSYDLIELT